MRDSTDVPRHWLAARRLVVLVSNLAVAAGLAGAPSLAAASSPVRARLVSDGVVSSEGLLEVGVILDLDPGWHVYWRHPGYSGLATEVRMHLPAGFVVGPVRWPVPSRFDAPGFGVDFGYAGQVGFPMQIRMQDLQNPQDRRFGKPIPVAVTVDWIGCNRVCIPGTSTARLDLELVAVDRREGVGEDAELDAWRARLPGAAPAEIEKTTARIGPADAEGVAEIVLELTWAAEPSKQLEGFPLLDVGLQVESLDTRSAGRVTRTRVRVRPRNAAVSVRGVMGPSLSAVYADESDPSARRGFRVEADFVD